MKNKYGILIKSDRALEAERAGLVTYSKLNAWQKRAVDEGAVLASEWHHTSAAANITYYYDLEKFDKLNSKDFPAKKEDKVVQGDLKRLKIIITFSKMVGNFTTAHKKFETFTVEGLDIRKRDNVIIGADGRRLNSNNESITYLYKGYRCKKYKVISKKEAEQLGYKFI